MFWSNFIWEQNTTIIFYSSHPKKQRTWENSTAKNSQNSYARLDSDIEKEQETDEDSPMNIY